MLRPKRKVNNANNHLLHDTTRHAPATAPATIVRMVFTLSDSAAAMWLSSGPNSPFEPEAPGLGAPPFPLPSPPPSMLWVAVGSGDWDVEVVEVALPLDVPFVDEFDEPVAVG